MEIGWGNGNHGVERVFEDENVCGGGNVGVGREIIKEHTGCYKGTYRTLCSFLSSLCFFRIKQLKSNDLY